MSLDTFEIDATVRSRGTVIWMHGLGATNHDFEDLIPELDTPYLRYVFPQAPSRPVTINGGMVMPAWYDILTLGSPSVREEANSVREGGALVDDLLRREIERGTPPGQIVLMGFSQGGALALYTGVRFPEALKGIVVLSGYLLLADRLERERHDANLDTPILFCHGTFDAVVPFELGRAASERVAVRSPVEFHPFDMPHSMCLAEVAVLRTWLQRRFGP